MADTPRLSGTLDLQVLRAVSLGSKRVRGRPLRIQRASGDGLVIAHGALHRAVFRLGSWGPVESAWSVPDGNRKAKCCKVTGAGRAGLAPDVDPWRRLMPSMDAVLGAPRARLAS